MAWGTIELEKEVEQWLLQLPDEHFGQVERYIDDTQNVGGSQGTTGWHARPEAGLRTRGSDRVPRHGDP